MAIIGALFDDDFGDFSGSAYIFEKDSLGTWVEQSKLVASDASAGALFGNSVSLSGGSVIIGAQSDSNNFAYSGSAYIFERDNAGVWIESIKLIAADGQESDYFGKAVGITSNAAVVGAPNVDDNGISTGATYLYQRNTLGDWVLVNKMYAADSTLLDGYGSPIATDGSTILISAPGEDTKGTNANSGAVYLYSIVE